MQGEIDYLSKINMVSSALILIGLIFSMNIFLNFWNSVFRRSSSVVYLMRCTVYKFLYWSSLEHNANDRQSTQTYPDFIVDFGCEYYFKRDLNQILCINGAAMATGFSLCFGI